MSNLEGLRSTVETEVTGYCLNHYKHGVCSVFSVNSEEGAAIVACVEDHQFEPKNYWFVCFKNRDCDYHGLLFIFSLAITFSDLNSSPLVRRQQLLKLLNTFYHSTNTRQKYT